MKYFDRNLEIIKNSLDSLDEKSFEILINECCNVVKNNGKIIFSGLGKNVPICEKIVGTLNSLGIQANFLHTNTAMHGDLGMICDNDLVVILSKSGNTSETIILANQLLNRKASIWGITFSDESKLSKILDKSLSLKLEEEGDKWNIVPNNSSSIYLILLQCLALQLADRLNITLSDFKINHPGGAIGEILKNEK